MPAGRQHALCRRAASRCAAAARCRPDAASSRTVRAPLGRECPALPEWATWRGDHRYGDRFIDASPAGRAAHDAWTRELLREAEAVPAQVLSATDQVSRELFIHDMAAQVRLQAYPGWRSRSLVSQWGFQSQLAGLQQASPMSTAVEYGRCWRAWRRTRHGSTRKSCTCAKAWQPAGCHRDRCSSACCSRSMASSRPMSPTPRSMPRSGGSASASRRRSGRAARPGTAGHRRPCLPGDAQAARLRAR